MALHGNYQPGEDIHTPYRQVFASEAARLADATVYVALDLHKKALQLDTMEEYVLTAIGPTTWTPVASDTIPAKTVTTNNATPIVIDTYTTMADNKAIVLDWRVEGYNAVDELVASFRATLTFNRDGAGPGVVTQRDVDFHHSYKQDGTWGTPDANIVGQDIQLRVTGEGVSGNDIVWKSRLVASEVG